MTGPISPQTVLHFAGPGITLADRVRLTGQHQRVFDVMNDGKPHTLAEIAAATLHKDGKIDSEAGISARLRDLRKPEFGSHTVERNRRANRGQYEYRMVF